MQRLADPGWTGHAKSGPKRRRNTTRYQREFSREFDSLPREARKYRKAATKAAKPKAYLIQVGTPVICKKKGRIGWKDHVTKKFLSFAKYNNRNRGESTFDFYEGDWIIRIKESSTRTIY